MRRIFAIAAASIILVLLIGFTMSTFITDWLWFKSLNFQSVFFTTLFSKWGLRIIIALFFFLLFGFNLYLVGKYIQKEPKQEVDSENVVPLRKYVSDRFINKKNINLLFLVVSIILALLLSSAASGQWLMVQQFFNKVSFGITDPIFNNDASFYVFSLPFYEFIYSLIFSGLIISIIVSGIAYFLIDPKNLIDFRDTGVNQPKVHLSVILAALFALKGYGYILDAYKLLNKPGGVVYGAGYTDVHANLLALRVLAVVAVIAALVILVNIFLKKFRLVLATIGGLIIISIILGGIYPYVIQKVSVEPDELNKETPYIKNNIEMTRMAYDIDKTKYKQYPVTPLESGEIRDNPETIQNIRLWDPRPMKSANSQLQEIRTYYQFKDIDIDRYRIDDDIRQIMISARELDKSNLREQAQTWVNKKLRYTHGYGATMSLVNSSSPTGLPNYVVKDMPPEASDENLEITRPQLYYSEAEDDYVIVNSKSEEFDYPSGDGNISTTYEGSGGVSLSGFINKALFALRYGEYRILISDLITNDSKIMFRKNISERVREIAPFLQYDKDPYIVANDGKLYWMQDAYTTAQNFPYSSPVSGYGNYIRNSIKIVIDAYDGDVTFYKMSDEPVVQSLSNIFPDLFEPYESMPEGLKEHIRYPEDLFRIQSEIHSTYHMTDVRDFYNREDVWNVPQEIVAGDQQGVEPYYALMKLPDEEEPEFVLMLPFTPSDKNNMAAWMAARSAPENYGEKLVYQFTKQELVYGPIQVEAEIDSNSEISEKLTLWGQRGSNIIRGNLLVVPINNGLIYVEPVFIEAEQSKLPALRRVIVFHDGNLVWAETFEEALVKLFGEEVADEPLEEEDRDIALELEEDEEIGEEIDEEIGEDTDEDIGVDEESDEGVDQETAETMDELIERAGELFEEAQRYQREGNWAEYGETLNELESVLNELDEMK